MELGEIDHQAGEQGLAGILCHGVQSPGKTKENRRVFLPHLDGSRKAQHIVDRSLHQADRAGDGGADNIGAFLGVAAVSDGIKAGNPATLHAKLNCGHTQTEIF